MNLSPHQRRSRPHALALAAALLGTTGCAERREPAPQPSASQPTVTSASGAPSPSVPPTGYAPGGSPPAQLPAGRYALLAADITAAWAVEGAVLVLRQQDGRRTLSRLAGDALVDEKLLSTGLPQPPPPGTRLDGVLPPGPPAPGQPRFDFASNWIEALGGRWPSPLVLGLTVPSTFGSSQVHTWNGSRWARSSWAPAHVFTAKPEWQSGRGLLFGPVNMASGEDDWPRWCLDPIGASLTRDLVKAARALPVEPRFQSHTWVAGDGTRATLLASPDEDRLLLGQTKLPPSPSRRTPPVYLRPDGTVVTGAVDAQGSVTRAAACNKTACAVSEIGATVAFFRELDGRLYAFSGPGRRVLRLDGERWRELAVTNPADWFVTAVGEADGASLLVVTRDEEGRRSLLRWTP